MLTVTETATILYPEWYDERAEWECEGKGWLNGVEVKLSDGRRVPLFIYDPVRLAQDLEANIEFGEPVVAERGLIVIPEVTRVAINAAVERMLKAGYFASE